VLVCQDAFVLSHTMMNTEVPSQEQVDAFLPTLKLPHQLSHIARTVGGLDFPHETEAHRRFHHEAMEAVGEVYTQCQDEFEEHFGRRPADRVVGYKMDDAEVVLISMGTTASTVRAAVDEARGRGERVGALRINVFRPFPEALLRSKLGGRKQVGVIDRNICPGLGGIVWGELRGVISGDTIVQGYITGLGGGDIQPELIGRILADLQARDCAGPPKLMEVGR